MTTTTENKLNQVSAIAIAAAAATATTAVFYYLFGLK